MITMVNLFVQKVMLFIEIVTDLEKALDKFKEYPEIKIEYGVEKDGLKTLSTYRNRW